MQIVNGIKISLQTRPEDVDRILDAVCAIDPLNYGVYDRNAMIRGNVTGMYKPQEGSTTHIHLGTTDLQIHSYVELEFIIAADTDLNAVLQAVIDNHHYEEPVISFHPVQTTRADYNHNSDNKNRWWHQDNKS